MIEVQNVSKRFGRVTALAGVSLHIAAGERVALVGTNGSGKTTLLRALCGLLRVEGQITLGGIDVAKDPARALAQLAYIPQIAPPLDAPVTELIRACARLRGYQEAAVADYAARLGLTLAEIARARVRDLSGGMKQKLLAAMALASEAPLLVCDEPTASLDAPARAAFFALAHARPKDATLVLCSHRSDEVRNLVERVIELDEGRVVRDGALESRLPRTLAHDERRSLTPLRLVESGAERLARGVP